MKKLIDDFKPDLIGIRSMSMYKNFFHLTAAVIRQWGIDVPIIAGGPYATCDYHTILRDKNIDVVVIGEGEVTFLELVTMIMENNKNCLKRRSWRQLPVLHSCRRQKRNPPH